VSIYGDVALTQLITQPVFIGPTGAYTFFYASSSAPVQVQISGRPDQIVGGGGSQPVGTTISGSDITFPGSVTNKRENNVRIAAQFCTTVGVLDQTCINNAITDFGAAPSCGTILMPFGEIDITATIGTTNLSGRYGCVFIGQGAPQIAAGIKGTYIKWTGAANGSMFDLHSCTNCRAENFTLDGNNLASQGQLVSSLVADGVSFQNQVKNIFINNIVGTPCYGIHVGTSTGYEVENTSIENVAMSSNVCTGIFQEGSNTVNALYKSFTLSSLSRACFEFQDAGSATIMTLSCTLPTGATGDIIIHNSFGALKAEYMDLEGTAAVPCYVMNDGVTSTQGPTVQILGGSCEAAAATTVLNYTQNGSLTIDSVDWGGGNALAVTINPIGPIGTGFGGLVRLRGNIWKATVITTSGSNYSVHSDDAKAGAAFYTGTNAASGNPLKIFDQANIQLIKGSELSFNGTNRFRFTQSGTALQFYRDAALTAQWFSGNTATLGSTTDFDIAQVVTNEVQFGDQTSASPEFRKSGTTLQARLADNSADAPLSSAKHTASSFATSTDCAVNSASPAACGAACAGAFVVPTTTTTYTVNTTCPTTNTSHIFLEPRTDGSGLPSAPTCVAPGLTTDYVRSAHVNNTSFTITLTSTTGTTCFDYFIVSN
jgi:hypothetical protein